MLSSAPVASEWVTTARAFGLTLHLHDDLEIAGLEPVRVDGAEVPTTVRLVAPRSLGAQWTDARPARVRELWHHEQLLMTVDHDAQAGFLVWTPAHGSFHVCADGVSVRCDPHPDAGTSWHGLLLGQVLPLAATVRGLEIFHAAAVAIDDGAVLVSASSGVGKSTLVAHLVQQGATLVADDATAIELVDGQPVVHPGPPLVHLYADVAATLEGPRLRPVDCGRTKRSLLAPSPRRPLRLRAFYLLERSAETVEPTIEERCVTPPELLGSTMTHAVRTPDRLLRRLDVCAALAASVPVRRLRLGAPDRAARALCDDVGRM